MVLGLSKWLFTAASHGKAAGWLNFQIFYGIYVSFFSHSFDSRDRRRSQRLWGFERGQVNFENHEPHLPSHPAQVGPKGTYVEYTEESQDSPGKSTHLPSSRASLTGESSGPPSAASAPADSVLGPLAPGPRKFTDASTFCVKKDNGYLFPLSTDNLRRQYLPPAPSTIWNRRSHCSLLPELAAS